MQNAGSKLKMLTFGEAAALPPAGIFALMETARSGLTPEQARERQAAFGPHVLDAKPVTPAGIFFRQFRSPMMYLLAAAAAVSLFLKEWIDGATILAILLINAGIGFFQEYRSEQALKKLSAHLSPRARVRRGGELIVIERSALAPGDVVVLQAGDIAPADLRLTLSNNLAVDESALTGESLAAAKDAAALSAAVSEPAEAKNFVFMPSVVVSGFAEGVVTATRAGTVIGRLARLVEETPRVSAFQKNMQSFSAFLLKAVMLVLVLVFAANAFLKGTEQIIPQLLFAVALAVSVIPEALPAVTAMTLASGALELAKSHVVVKRLSSIEDLGHVQILCTDKTGTITQSILSVEEIDAADPRLAHLLAMAVAAEEEHANVRHPKTFDAALVAHADRDLLTEHEKTARYWFAPFTPARRRASAVVTYAGKRWLAALGAPEEILKRTVRRLTAEGEAVWNEADRRDEEARIRAAGLRGRRVLALAIKEIDERADYGENDEQGLTYVGSIAFSDPLKPTAKKAIHDAKRLQVEVKIITGDSAEVAGAVGKEVGILNDAGEALTGAALDVMNEEEFHRAVERRAVFARVSPEQKFRIIGALQRKFRVGFLGEGINDAPALKLADVALVVESASDVAREAADIILMRKDLHVIVDGIRRGRAIFTNIVKYVKYTLVGNFGNFIAIAGISLLIDYLPMLPVQILLTNILTDLPLVTVAGDSVDEGELLQPKKFNIRELAFIGIFLGSVSSFFDFAYFGLHRSQSPETVQTLWFLFSVMTELALIYSIRSRLPFWKASRPGIWLVAVTGLTLVLAAALPFVGAGREIFHFIAPSARQFLVVALLALGYFAATEAVKLTYGRFFKTETSPA